MFMFLIGLTLASNLTLCTLWVLRTAPALSYPTPYKESRTEASALLASAAVTGAPGYLPPAILQLKWSYEITSSSGSVNANKRHWYKGSEALARADRSWLNRLITRTERPENFARALERRSADIKVVHRSLDL